MRIDILDITNLTKYNVNPDIMKINISFSSRGMILKCFRHFILCENNNN